MENRLAIVYLATSDLCATPVRMVTMATRHPSDVHHVTAMGT